MKILMLNATEMNVPFILAAKRIGFDVFTTGNRPDFYGHQFAGRYVNADYSDYTAMEQLVNEYGIDAVCCGTSDNCAMTAAFLGEKLNLKGHDSFATTGMIHRKDAFKAFTKEHGIKSPIAEIYETKEEALGQGSKFTYPVMVKPSNAAGGKGITKVEDPSKYDEAVQTAFDLVSSVAYAGDNSSGIVVEPFVTGRLYSLMAFIVDHSVRAWCTWEDYSFLYPYMVSSGNTVFKEDLPYAEEVAAEVDKLAKAAQLVDGQITVQFIVQNGEPWIIEAMRRSPGNYTTTFAGLATGIDWNEWIVRAEAGLDCSQMPQLRQGDDVYGYATLLSSTPGVFAGVDIDNSLIQNIEIFTQWKTPGFEITNPASEKMGIAILKFGSEEEASTKMKNIHNLLKVKTVLRSMADVDGN